MSGAVRFYGYVSGPGTTGGPTDDHVWTREAARSLVGQMVRLTVGFDFRDPLGCARIVSASPAADDGLFMTLDVPSTDAARLVAKGWPKPPEDGEPGWLDVNRIRLGIGYQVEEATHGTHPEDRVRLRRVKMREACYMPPPAVPAVTPTTHEDVVLGRILRRFLTEDQPGYDLPAYADLRQDELVLDGDVTVTDDTERALVARLIGERDG